MVALVAVCCGGSSATPTSAEVWRHIRAADAPLLLASAVIAMAGFGVRALRWKYFLAPVQRHSPFGSRFAAVAVGFMANNLLPSGRAGEPGRAYAYSRMEPVGFTAALATLVVERLLDGAVIFALIFVAILGRDFPLETLPERLADGMRIAAAGLGVVLAGTVLVVAFPARCLAMGARAVALLPPGRLSTGLTQVMEGVVGGLSSMRGWRLMLPALAWTFGVWLLQSLSFWAGFLAFDIPPSLRRGDAHERSRRHGRGAAGDARVPRDTSGSRISRPRRGLRCRPRTGPRLRRGVARCQLPPDHGARTVVCAATRHLAEGLQGTWLGAWESRTRAHKHPARDRGCTSKTHKPRTRRLPMTVFSIACPAKLNLFLRIVAREPSGYHQIETLFQAIGLYDRIDVHPDGHGIAFEVRAGETDPGLGDMTGELGDHEENTVVRAAQSFFDATGIEPAVRLVLTKAIPAGTGLGGASSDAAGTLAVFECACTGIRSGTNQIIREGGWIGSDVPFFCTGMATALAWRRGDRFLDRPPPPAAHVVLAIPEGRTSTAAAYSEVSAMLKLPAPPRWLGDIETDAWEELAALQHNDFELVAFERTPSLRAMRDALSAAGAVMAGMTGSGTAIYGVFVDEGRAADAARTVGAMEGVAGALVVPTLSEMPAVRQVDADM